MKWSPSGQEVEHLPPKLEVTSISFYVESGEGGTTTLTTLPAPDSISRINGSSFKRGDHNGRNAKVAVLRVDSIEEIPASDVIGNTGATEAATPPEPIPPPALNNRHRSIRSVMADPQGTGHSASTAQLVAEESPAALPHLFGLDVAALMAMNVSLANIWRLPIFIQFGYPGEALIAYVILMTVVGLPLFVMELGLGQLARSGIVKVWRAAPIFKGVGVGQVVIGLYVLFYYPTLMTWAFAYGVVGIGNWDACGLADNLTGCLCLEEASGNCTVIGVITAEEKCFQEQVLATEAERMNYKLLPMLAVVMILLSLCVSFGERTMRWILATSGAAVVVLLSAALALALVHPHNTSGNNTALSGIRLLNPTGSSHRFGRGEVWYGAMVQTIFSLALGFGTLPSMSSSSYFHRDIVWCGALLWLSNIGFAILSVITVFAWMGVSGFHESVTAQANAFPFHVYQHISGSLSAALAFAIIFLSGFNGTVPIIHATLHNIGENFPILKDRYWTLTHIALSVSVGLVNVPGLLQEGHDVTMMWDHFAAGATVLSMLILHVLGFAWVYRGQLHQDFELMIGRSISPLWSLSWRYVTLTLLTVFELWGFLGLPLDGTVDCRYPVWLTAAGWATYLGAVCLAEAIIAWVVIRQMETGWMAKITAAVRPDRRWKRHRPPPPPLTPLPSSQL